MPARLLVVFAIVAILCGYANASMDSLQWGPCPANPLSADANDCATLMRPLDPLNASSTTIGIFIRRYYDRSVGPSNNSLWMLDGGPGFSSAVFAPIAKVVYGLDKSLTVYLADQRGTGLSNYINCASPPTAAYFDPFNATMVAMFDACNMDIVNRYGAVSRFYSAHHAAQDLKAAVDAVAPAKVAVYALSFGTYITNIYLQLPGARADAVVFDGPVPPNRWALENNAEWVSRVSRDVLSDCATHSAACAAHLGTLGLIPRFVMDSIIDGTLPCLAKLPWLTQHIAATDAAFMTLNGAAHVLQGPFWWRLYRCSDLDVQQLNTFRTYRSQSASVPVSQEYSYALGTIIGASEVYSFASGPVGSPGGPMSYDQQVYETGRVFADASPQLVVSRIRRVLPLYTPDPSTYKKFASPSMPVLVMVGTLDPNTPHGLGRWFVDGLGPSATLVTIPFSAHGTVAYNAPCANAIAFSFLFSFGSVMPDMSCLNTIPVPDFDGVTVDIQQMSQLYFGTTNLWNDVPLIPPFSKPVSCSSSSGGQEGMSDAKWMAIVISLGATTAVFAVLSVLLFVQRSAALGNKLQHSGADYARMTA
eukprot:ANDGO_00105.mRNA.1 hypothetical protein PPTG_15474